MLVEGDMSTSINSRVVIKNSNPVNNLEKELRIRNFSFKTMYAYLYYNK